MRGAWIETYAASKRIVGYSRAPCGARGLKHTARLDFHILHRSRPVRGAWIETAQHRKLGYAIVVAPRAGRVD